MVQAMGDLVPLRSLWLQVRGGDRVTERLTRPGSLKGVAAAQARPAKLFLRQHAEGTGQGAAWPNTAAACCPSDLITFGRLPGPNIYRCQPQPTNPNAVTSAKRAFSPHYYL